MTYTILEFEDGLQLVPSKWLVDGQGKSFYPPFISQLRVARAIEEQENPGKDWKKYIVQRKHGTAATYEQGIKKLNLVRKTERTEMDKQNSNNEDSMEESKKSRVAAAHKRLRDDIDDDCPSPKRVLSPLQVRKHLEQDQNIQVLYRPQTVWVVEKENETKFVGNLGKEFSQFNKLIGKLETVHEMNQNLETVEMNKKLDITNQRIGKIQARDQMNHSTETVEEENVEEVVIEKKMFPINSVEGLEEFDRKLQNPGYFMKMVNFLKQPEGMNVSYLVTSSLRKLLTNDLAYQYSWHGKNKRAFEPFALNKVIFETVRVHNKTAKEDDVNKIIKRWLVAAKIRKLTRKIDD